MKLHYDEQSDLAYIELLEQKAIESEEIEEGVVADYDASGRIIGVEINHFSKRFATLFAAINDEKLKQIFASAA